MLQEGMVCYTNERYHSVMKHEMSVFVNMLEIVHLWEKDMYIFDDKIYDYIRYNIEDHINLRNMFLEKADLNSAKLLRADLRGANLQEVDLRHANLCNADLTGACIKNTIFDEEHLRFLKTKCSLPEIKVCVYESGEVLSYNDFINFKRTKIENLRCPKCNKQLIDRIKSNILVLNHDNMINICKNCGYRWKI